MNTHGPVMVIEDDTDVRQLLAERVRDDGYRTVEVPSGERALELARQEAPCLVLLDLQLPGMSGWDVLRQFRTEQDLTDIPVVVVSIIDPTTAPHPSVDGYLVKPFNADQIHHTITQLAGRKREAMQ